MSKQVVSPKFLSFPAKVLLFGEYLVIDGDQALAIPIQNYSGQLKLSDDFEEANIAPFVQYLGALPNIYLDQELIESIDLGRLIFDSDIPVGYGAGSSGALTAAVYDAFVLRHEGELQDALASMEDYFHGSSSGLDPYISWTRKPTLAIDRRAIDHFYLLDTGLSRKTAPLVEIYKQKDLDVTRLGKFNATAIAAAIEFDPKNLGEAMQEISLFQFEHFQEMILVAYKEVWKEVLEDPFISMKLCGAGGGGFLLLYCVDEDYLGKWSERKEHSIIKIAM